MKIYNGNIQGYFDNPAWSQSKLKLLLNTVDEYNEKMNYQETILEQYSEDKIHFTLGSLVDFLLTSHENFNNKYYIKSNSTKISDTIIAIINHVFETVSSRQEPILSLIDYLEEVYNSCNMFEYYMNRKKEDWREDTRFKSIITDDGITYFNQLIESLGKTIIDNETYSLAKTIVNSIKSNSVVKHLFDEDDRNDVYFQKSIFHTENGIEYKALLDVIDVNHESKTIQIYDIKTTSDFVINFPKSVMKFRYDIQSAFYDWILKLSIKEKKYKDYKVLPFKFIVVSTKTPTKCTIFECNSNIMTIGFNGDLYNYGVSQLIEAVKYHIKNNFTIDKVLNNSIVELDWGKQVKHNFLNDNIEVDEY